MTSREDLIETAARALYERSRGGPAGDLAKALAEAVLDAVLPEITTAEQLEALPAGQWFLAYPSPEEGPSLWWWDGHAVRFGGTSPKYTADWFLDHYGPLTVVWQP